MADLMFRHRLLLWTHVGMLVASAALVAVSWLNLFGSWTLLFLTFAIGCCSASLAITARLCWPDRRVRGHSRADCRRSGDLLP